jgi:hypothetical protein
MGGVLLASSCGSDSVQPAAPLQAPRVAEAAVTAAIRAGAEYGNRSRKYLDLARKQLQEVRALVKEGDDERAEWVARRAQADAELALALANEEQVMRGPIGDREGARMGEQP